MSAKTSDYRPGPTLCRCCFADGCYKDISTEYFWMGKREVYSEMLTETFSVSIGYQSAGPNSNSRLICEACIARLRDSSDFKRQVQECEKTFMQHLDPSGSLVDMILESDREVKLETGTVKLKDEKESDDDYDEVTFGIDDMDDDDDDLDDQPLTAFKAKVPKKEVVEIIETAKPEKRKAPTKLKVIPTKKLKKKEAPKPTPSKAPVAEKKDKKKADNYDPARSNAEVIIRCATAYPFRVNDKCMLCVYCQELYEDPAIFRAHMASEHEDFSLKVAFHNLPKSEFIKADLSDLKCRLCSEPHRNLDSIAEHLKNVHEQPLDLSGKLGVMPYVIEKDSYNCAVCSKSFPSLFHLNRHTITHFLSYVCHVCGSSYVATTGLLRHVRSKHQDYEVSCKRCKKVFPSMEAKERHRRKEKSCMPYCCPKCSERFLDWKSRKRHMETDHGHEKKTLRCADCDLTFAVESAYYDHFKLHHSNDCVTCKHCGLKFLSLYRLKRHLKRHSL